MPNPTSTAVHIDRPLTNIAVAYTQTGDFIARRVFANVPVSKQSDQYWKYNKADWLRSQAQRRAPGTESAGSGWTLDTDNYRCDVFAIHKDIDDEAVANQDNPINLNRDATRWVTRQLLMKQEIDWRDAYYKTGVWGLDLTGVASAPGANQFLKWGDAASDPINDVGEQQDRVLGVTGYKPNVGVAGVRTARVLRSNPDVIDRIKYTQRGVATNELVASLLNLDAFLIPTAITDTSTEGAATEAPGFIFSDDDFLLVYRTSTPSLFEPTGGYTFTWTGFVGSSEGTRIKRMRMEHLNSTRIEGEMSYDQKLVASDVGVFFSDAVD